MCAMFKPTLQKIYKIKYKVNNIEALKNKIEPFPILYLIFGLRSWSIESGNKLTSLQWSAKVYIIVTGVLFMYACTIFIPVYLSKSKSSLIFYFGTILLNVGGIINISIIWYSNITSNAMLKILKKMDDLESFVPKVSGFIHGESYFFIFIHLFSMSNVLYNAYLSSQIPNMSIDIAIVSSLWRHWFIFTCNYSIYQFCNIINILSSYTNIINMALCTVFNKHAYYKHPNDPIMYVLKSKIIRYTDIDPTKEHIFTELDVGSLESMYEILMDALELANDKFSVGVRIKKLFSVIRFFFKSFFFTTN